MSYKTQVTLWVIGLIIIAVIISWLAFGGEQSARPPDSSSKQAVFRCSQNKQITAHFADSYVRLELSNGQHFMLKHVISASGGRYANKDQSIVFWNKGNTAFIVKNDSLWFSRCVQKGQNDLVHLHTYQSADSPVRFRYPRVLRQRLEAIADTTGWSSSSTEKGELIAQFSLEGSLKHKTNLLDATFTVGRNSSKQALKKCLKPARAAFIHSDTIQKGSTKFVLSKYADAGAGNLYNIKQYRTIYHKSCYSIEEMVHSTHVQYYPPERGITAFDSARVWKALNVPWETFVIK